MTGEPCAHSKTPADPSSIKSERDTWSLTGVEHDNAYAQREGQCRVGDIHLVARSCDGQCRATRSRPSNGRRGPSHRLSEFTIRTRWQLETPDRNERPRHRCSGGTEYISDRCPTNIHTQPRNDMRAQLDRFDQPVAGGTRDPSISTNSRLSWGCDAPLCLP